MDTCPARLILLPGMGADRRLFEPQRAVFPRLTVPDWLAPEPSETLEAYGRRMADAMVADRPFWLGGASLGGMVALEMARHIEPEAVFLIGSCRSARAVPAYLRFLERLTRPLPDGAVELSRALSPLFAGKLHGLDPDQRRLVVAMMRATPTAFLRWASRAVMGWAFEGPLGCPVHHIHGDRDRLIPLRRVQPSRVVEGGGHLISLTHPDIVNAFLTEHIAAPSSSRDDGGVDTMPAGR